MCKAEFLDDSYQNQTPAKENTPEKKKKKRAEAAQSQMVDGCCKQRYART